MTQSFDDLIHQSSARLSKAANQIFLRMDRKVALLSLVAITILLLSQVEPQDFTQYMAMAEIHPLSPFRCNLFAVVIQDHFLHHPKQIEDKRSLQIAIAKCKG